MLGKLTGFMLDKASKASRSRVSNLRSYSNTNIASSALDLKLKLIEVSKNTRILPEESGIVLTVADEILRGDNGLLEIVKELAKSQSANEVMVAKAVLSKISSLNYSNYVSKLENVALKNWSVGGALAMGTLGQARKYSTSSDQKVNKNDTKLFELIMACAKTGTDPTSVDGVTIHSIKHLVDKLESKLDGKAKRTLLTVIGASQLGFSIKYIGLSADKIGHLIAEVQKIYGIETHSEINGGGMGNSKRDRRPGNPEYHRGHRSQIDEKATNDYGVGF